MKQRDPFFDNAKILLMVLVVLGHVLPIGFNQKVNVATFEWIFSFHMPLFVFISGYFTRITNSKKFWDGLLDVVETLIVFTIVHVAISYFLGKPLFLSSIIVFPQWTLWYLLSLICWRLMLYYTPSSILSNHRTLIIISLVLCLALGWVPLGKELSFQRTFALLPFFVIGFVAGVKQIKPKSSQRQYFHVAFFVVIALLYFFIPKIISTILYQNYSYLRGPSSPLVCMCLRAGWLVFAGCMSYSFLSIVPRKEYRWTHFGQLTLFIYMYHAIILSCRYLLRDSFNLPTSVLHCILYTAIVLAMIWLMSKIKIFHWLLNPISSTINRINKEKKNY